MPPDANSSTAIGMVLAGLFASLNPWAITGASFGCFFFLFASSLLPRWQRFQLLIFSWGVGWAAGEYGHINGEPYGRGSMLVSAVVAALAAGIFTAFYHVIDKGTDMPPWLIRILELVDKIPFLRRGGGEK